MTEKKTAKSWIFAILSVIGLVAFDQYTKLLAITKLKDQSAFVILDGIFELQYLENRGAAFGMLQNQRAFFIIITCVMMFVIMYFYHHTPKSKKYLPLDLCMIFITAGAIGNFIDRLFRGFVVDFFYFSLINFPIFNVADIYVTVTFFVLVLLIFFYYKDEDFEVYSVKPFKK